MIHAAPQAFSPPRPTTAGTTPRFNRLPRDCHAAAADGYAAAWLLNELSASRPSSARGGTGWSPTGLSYRGGRVPYGPERARRDHAMQRMRLKLHGQMAQMRLQ